MAVTRPDIFYRLKRNYFQVKKSVTEYILSYRCKTKPKVNITAYPNNFREVRENICDLVAISFSFASDWLRGKSVCFQGQS